MAGRAGIRVSLLAGLLTGCSSPGPDSSPGSGSPPQAPAGKRTASREPQPIQISPDRFSAGPDDLGAYLANGYLGLRCLATGTGYLPGVKSPTLLAGHYNAQDSLEGLPPLLPLQIEVNGKVLGTDPAQVKLFHQELRLKEGTLVTRFIWEPDGGKIAIDQETALLVQQPDLAVVRCTVKNEGSAAAKIGLAEAAGAPSMAIERDRFTWDGSGVRCTGVLRRLDQEAPAGAGEPGITVPGGSTAVVALVTHVAGPAPRPANALEAVPTVQAAQVESWLAGHRAAWAKRWRSDIEIEGDPEAQQVIRACLFQILCSTRAGSSTGVPPMGLSAQAFGGHVFWDMDSWILPAMLPQHPDLARAMLEYRFRTLHGARANAQAEGKPGAGFAWESGKDGKEALRGSEFSQGRHVSGDVALALRQYSLAQPDRTWLAERAWPILQATADNWVARAQPAQGGFEVRNVTTPDENAGLVGYSAWTQHVARENLQFALEAARALGKPANPRWGKVAAGLAFRRLPGSKLILAHDKFTERSRAKQADAMLLAHPGRVKLSPEELGRMYDFYVPRVIATGPAMTDAIHALLAARLGRAEEAEHRFRESYRPFVRGPFLLFSEKRTRDNLCFLTGAAGVIEAALYGFAGLELADADRPKLKPHLPASWKRLTLRNLQWRGKAWDVVLTPDAPPAWAAAAIKE
jgi:trehalose/maltose hydrolase-like predicted phosphorylase